MCLTMAAPNAEPRLPAIAIVGNMNVGKTTLFQRMCGLDTRSVDFPGSTVAIARGRIRRRSREAIDTPGTFSVFSQNEDERVARDILLSFGTDEQIEGVILVADAKNLKRSLALALEYAEYGLPMLLDVNMVDESEARGIRIDYAKLSEIFGVEVCPSVAIEGRGVRRIRRRLGSLKTPRRLMQYPSKVEEFIDAVRRLLSSGSHKAPSRGVALLLLAGDPSAERYVSATFGQGMLEQVRILAQEHREGEPGAVSVLLTSLYTRRAEEIASQVQSIAAPPKSTAIQRFGEWCTQLSTGIPIVIAIVCLMYLFVGLFGASFLVDTLQRTAFDGFLIPLCSELVAPIPSALLRDIIMDPDFGILPTGVFLALGLVLPVLFCFYLFFGVLEDSGYLARLSFLLDKAFRSIGLNGKGVMPMTMGFSCVTMAILSTRMLDTEKERNIASFLLMFAMPCAPLLGVMFVILEKMPASATLAVFGVIFSQILLAGFAADRLIPGRRAPLLMEIVPMRIPNPFWTGKKAALRTYAFVKEAIPVFVFASVLVFSFDRLGGLAALQKVLQPLTEGALGLPEKSVQVFIKTMIRRESGAAELEHVRALYTNLQLVVNLIVMIFLVPCMNSAIVLFKERGLKAGACITVAVVVYGIVVGAMLNHICRLLGVTFA